MLGKQGQSLGYVMSVETDIRQSGLERTKKASDSLIAVSVFGQIQCDSK